MNFLTSDIEELNRLIKMGIKCKLEMTNSKVTVNHRVIFKVLERGEITFAKLSEYSRLSKSTLSEALRKYEELGLVEKRIDPMDSRIMYVRLTELGEQECELMRSNINELAAKCMDGISKEEMIQMKSTIRKLIENAEELLWL